jgi:hypothetical protein
LDEPLRAPPISDLEHANYNKTGERVNEKHGKCSEEELDGEEAGRNGEERRPGE